ncbi:hypothetical protein Q9233_007571 [Columba guinea]|nr:hypothetical protein Q9233_007571 [Columba guinea]
MGGFLKKILEPSEQAMFDYLTRVEAPSANRSRCAVSVFKTWGGSWCWSVDPGVQAEPALEKECAALVSRQPGSDLTSQLDGTDWRLVLPNQRKGTRVGSQLWSGRCKAG